MIVYMWLYILSLHCIITFDFCYVFFFFKQKTAYEMRISDWSSDVCSSDLEPMRNNITAKLRPFFYDRWRTYIPNQAHAEPYSSLGPHQIGRASCRERVCQYV